MLVAVAAALAALVASPSSAHGHAAFAQSSPAAGARIEQSPARLVLTFTEPLNGGLSRGSVTPAAGGQSVPLVAAGDGRTLVLVPRGPLPKGPYLVRWHTVSTQDGHALEGTFSFGVRTAATTSDSEVEQSPFARSGWLRIGLRAVLYVSLLLWVASALIPRLLGLGRRSWVAPPDLDARLRSQAIALRERERRIAGELAWVALAAAIATTLAEAADAAGGLSANGVSTFLFNGEAGIGRLALIGALLLAALQNGRARLAALLAVVASWGLAASGHAASAEPRGWSILNDWVHLLSGAVWLGGIGMLALVWGPTLRRNREARRLAAERVLPEFGRVALPAFFAVAATGVVSLTLQLSAPGDLIFSAYGRLLLIKIVLVGVLAIASSVHVWVLRPRARRPTAAVTSAERRHWRLVRGEPIVGICVVLAVALLVTFPLPPEQLASAQNAVASAEAPCDPCPLPTPAGDELSVADRAGTQLVSGLLRSAGGVLTGTIRVFDLRGQPSRTPFEVPGAEETDCGRGCSRIRVPARERLAVRVQERGRTFTADLPSAWEHSANAEARRRLVATQAVMRSLRSVRQREFVTSGPGSVARTVYRLQAPNRLALKTGGGVRTVIIGDRQWTSTRESPWARGSYGEGLPFALRRWFRWSTYSGTARILDRRREGGRRVLELALADPATPLWIRLVVDVRTRRVVREQIAVSGHFTSETYEAFDQPTEVEAPRVR
ncbi:MAG: copper resistance protein CopC [Solirubrobacteraceae bacterium]